MAQKFYHFDHPGLLEIDTPFEAKADTTDWKAGASYQFTDELMGYASASTGSRPPGLYGRPQSIYQLSTIPAESLTSYEAGIKSEFLNHRVRLNLAAFYSDYKNQVNLINDYECLGQAPPKSPVTAPALCPPGGSISWGYYIATPAKVKGIELEATAEPIPDLVLNLNGGYNDFKSGINTPGAPGYLAPGNLPQPRFNASGGVQYGWHTPYGVFTPRVDWVFESTQTFDPSPTTESPIAQYTIPSYSIFNGRLTYEPNDSKWRAVFQVANMTNKYYFYSIFPFSGFDTTGALAPPREYQVTLHRSF